MEPSDLPSTLAPMLVTLSQAEVDQQEQLRRAEAINARLSRIDATLKRIANLLQKKQTED